MTVRWILDAPSYMRMILAARTTLQRHLAGVAVAAMDLQCSIGVKWHSPKSVDK